MVARLGSPAAAGRVLGNAAAEAAREARSWRALLVGWAALGGGAYLLWRYLRAPVHAWLTALVMPPPSGGLAPPGVYLLFVLDAARVPSTGRFITIA